MAYNYIDTTGLILPDTADLHANVTNEFLEAFGRDLVVTPESPEGLLISVETEARDSVIRNNAELANQINPDHAGGVFLDAIAALTGLKREGAVSSMVVGTLAGVPGTIIPSGSRAETEAGDIFVLQHQVMLGASGRENGFFASAVADAIPAPAGTLTKILDGGVLGWETLINAASAIPGHARESDTVFRKKRDDTLFLQGVALSGAIQSAVRAVPGVRSLAFRENTTHEEQVIDGVTIPPHTIYIVVDGGSDEDVARALFKNKSLGCGWKGSVTVQVQDDVSGQRYTVRFDRPEYVPVRARITVRVLGGVTLNFGVIVRQAILDYADDLLEGLRGFRIGTAVSPFEMAVAIGTVEPAIFVLNCQIGPLSAAPENLTSVTIPLELWQKATITQASIDVVSA